LHAVSRVIAKTIVQRTTHGAFLRLSPSVANFKSQCAAISRVKVQCAVNKKYSWIPLC